MMKRYSTALAAVLMGAVMALGGCGFTGQTSEQGAAEASSQETKATSSATAKITLEKDAFIDSIVERGKLIAGCKMDVPGLGLYDQEKEEWSGLEVELAYKTAGLIFDVSPDEAKEKDLVEFVGVTVADREEKLEAGDIDCMLATYTITEERAERFAISDSYYTDYIGLMVLDHGEDMDTLGGGDIESIADLDGKYIGVPRNATTRENFLNYIDTMNTVKVSPIFCEYESYEQLYNALKNGNIDVMSVDVSILNGYVDNSTKILDARFAGQHYGAAVQKGHEALINYLNAAIAE